MLLFFFFFFLGSKPKVRKYLKKSENNLRQVDQKSETHCSYCKSVTAFFWFVGEIMYLYIHNTLFVYGVDVGFIVNWINRVVSVGWDRTTWARETWLTGSWLERSWAEWWEGRMSKNRAEELDIKIAWEKGWNVWMNCVGRSETCDCKSQVGLVRPFRLC